MFPYPSRRHADYPALGATPSASADERALVADWLAHVEAGRIGVRLPVNEEARAIVLANERLMLGRLRSRVG